MVEIINLIQQISANSRRKRSQWRCRGGFILVLSDWRLQRYVSASSCVEASTWAIELFIILTWRASIKKVIPIFVLSRIARRISTQTSTNEHRRRQRKKFNENYGNERLSVAVTLDIYLIIFWPHQVYHNSPWTTSLWSPWLRQTG